MTGLTQRVKKGKAPIVKMAPVSAKRTRKLAEAKAEVMANLSKADLMDAINEKLFPTLIAMQSLYARKIVGDARTPLISDDNDLLSISATLGRLPKNATDEYVKFVVPNPLHSLDTSTVCVIVADHLNDEEREKYKAEVDRSSRHYQMLFAQHGVEGVDLVISNTQLKREYNTFESLAALAQAYDVFVVDRRVNAQVFKFLGAPFRKKAKFPQLAELSDPTKAAANIKDAVSRVTLKIGKFSPLVSCKFGRATWGEEDLVENALVVIEKMLDHVYGGWTNVKMLAISHRKFPHLPLITQSETSVQSDSTRKRFAAKSVSGELTCSDDPNMSTIRVTSDGLVKIESADTKKEHRVAVEKFTDEEKSQARARGRTSKNIQRRAMMENKKTKKRTKSVEKDAKTMGKRSKSIEKPMSPVKKAKVETPVVSAKKVKVDKPASPVKKVETPVAKKGKKLEKTPVPSAKKGKEAVPEETVTPIKKIKMVTADGDEKRAANKATKAKKNKKSVSK